MANQYTIKKGETLGGLAQQFGTTIANLQSLNPNITNPNVIVAGQNLNVPTVPSAIPVTMPTQNGTPVIDSDVLLSQRKQLQIPVQNQVPQVSNFQQTSPLVQTPTQQPVDYSDNSAIRRRLSELTSQLGGNEIKDLQTKLAKSSTQFNLRSEDYRSGQVTTQELSSGKIAQNERQKAIINAGIASEINAIVAPLEAEAQALKDFYELNQNDLSESEKMKLQSQLDISEYKAKAAADNATASLGLQPTAPTTYVVKPTDTGGLFQIASDRGIDWEQFKLANPQLGKDFTIKPGQVVNLPTTDFQRNQDALQVILGSGKFTKDQKNSLIQAINSGQDPFTVIKNQAKNLMGQTLATDLDKAETAKQQLQSIDSLLKEFYANGGKTGVFSGNYEKTLNNLGEVNDPDVVNIATQISLAMQAYRLAVTGTAASVQEDTRIDNVFPGITKGEVLNNARTQATIQSFDNKINAAYRNTLGPVYDQFIEKTAITPQVYNGYQLPSVETTNNYNGFNIPN